MLASLALSQLHALSVQQAHTHIHNKARYTPVVKKAVLRTIK